jgi:sulfide:quinone oxidoreductase
LREPGPAVRVGFVRVLILGAGFGGLELAATLSEELGGEVEVTLIDRADGFVFGFAKLDVLFGRSTVAEVKTPYAQFAKPGVRFVRETVTAIDVGARRVATDAGSHDFDVLVIALGAAYDLAATPGVAEAGEFYSVAGVERLRGAVDSFAGGRAVVGVCGAPFKCPPAPSECALMLDDHLRERGLREASEVVLVMPFSTPVPPSPEASRVLLETFAERGIEFVPGRRVASVETGRRAVVLDDGSELAYDLFLGVPRHRAPDVVLESGLAEEGYVPVESGTLRTRASDVYAVGDVATVGVPKAGVFAEGAARTVARAIVAQVRGDEEPPPFAGKGGCYIEFGGGLVGRVDVDFLSGPSPTGTLAGPSLESAAEKRAFGSARRARWFGNPI